MGAVGEFLMAGTPRMNVSTFLPCESGKAGKSGAAGQKKPDRGDNFQIGQTRKTPPPGPLIDLKAESS
jgi:hypothetical protein